MGVAKEGEPQYVVVHCTGYVKSWPPAGETSTFFFKLCANTAICYIYFVIWLGPVNDAKFIIISIVFMRYHMWPMLTQFLHVCVLGVSLTDDEADNTQGSRYCLVAIGRLQV